MKKNLSPILFCALALLTAVHVFMTVSHGYFYFLQLQHSSYDLGLHIHGIWKMSFGSDNFNTLRGANYLGDHLWLINYLLIPIFALFPSVITLFTLQSLALGGSALLIYKISEHTNKNPWYSFVLGIAWLIHPALLNMNLENYHPEVLATFFLTGAILSYLKNKIPGMYVLLFIACLCKEDVALTALTFCGLLYLLKKEKHYLAAAFLFLGFFIISLKIILPFYNEVGFFRHEDGYWFSGLANSWWKPEFYKKVFFRDYVAVYIAALFGPVVFLCFRKPLYLLPVLPSLLINILSGVKYLSSVDYHYNNQTLPYLFWAATAGFASLKNKRWQWAFMSLTVICSIVFSQILNHVSIPTLAKNTWNRMENPYYDEKRKSFEKIHEVYLSSEELVISASHNLTPNLSLRHYIYAYPNPYVRSNYGLSLHQPYNPAKKADYVLLDMSVDSLSKAETLLKENAFLVYSDLYFLLYKTR